MADPAAHEACSAQFAALAETCAKEPFSSMPRGAAWEIVFRFYSALHLMEGYLRAKGDDWASTDHGKRKQQIKAAPELKQGDAAKRFFDLQDMSVQVRYEPDFSASDEDFKNAREWATRISNVVAPKLKAKL